MAPPPVSLRGRLRPWQSVLFPAAAMAPLTKGSWHAERVTEGLSSRRSASPNMPCSKNEVPTRRGEGTPPYEGISAVPARTDVGIRPYEWYEALYGNTIMPTAVRTSSSACRGRHPRRPAPRRSNGSPPSVIARPLAAVAIRSLSRRSDGSPYEGELARGTRD